AAWERGAMPIDRIRVMISSQNKDYPIAGGGTFPLSSMRSQLCQEIAEARLFGEPIFECWINEREPSQANNVWDECLDQVRRAHVVIALYNGAAGWANTDSEVGICHAELQAALRSGRGRTHVIQLPPSSKASGKRDQRFQELVRQELFFSGTPTTN